MRRILPAGNKPDGAIVGGLEEAPFISISEILGHSWEQHEPIAEGSADRDARESSFVLPEVSAAGGISGKSHFWTELIR